MVSKYEVHDNVEVLRICLEKYNAESFAERSRMRPDFRGLEYRADFDITIRRSLNHYERLMFWIRHGDGFGPDDMARLFEATPRAIEARLTKIESKAGSALRAAHIYPPREYF